MKYYSPEQLTADARKAAQEKAFSAEEEKRALGKIPAGGTRVIVLYASTIGAANPELLTYVIFNSRGEVIDRIQGNSNVPSNKDGMWWKGFDQFDLPAIEDSLRLRVYDELDKQTLGEYVFRPNQKLDRVCCDQFLPPEQDLKLSP